MRSIDKLEQKLAIECKFNFVIDRTQTYLDIDDIEPISASGLDTILFSRPTLKELHKEIRAWMKRKRVAFVDQGTYSEEGPGFFHLVFDMTDCTVYCLVEQRDQKNDLREIDQSDVDQVIKDLEKTKFVHTKKKKS